MKGVYIMPKIVNLPMEEIIKDYESGFRSVALGEKYGVHHSTILKHLKKHGVEIKRYNLKKIELPVDEIIKDYQLGMNTSDLAQKYGVSYNVIYTRLKKHGIKVEYRRYLPMGEVIEDYKNGLSLADLTQKYKCSKATIYRRFEEYRVKVRSKGGSERKSLPVEDIIKDYENGIPVRDLGAWHGVHHSTITSRIRESGVEVRNGKKEFPMGEVIMDYTSGLSYRKLADKYDSTPKTIKRDLKNMELK